MSFIDRARGARKLHVIASADLAAWRKAQAKSARDWLAASGFAGKPGDLALVPEGRSQAAAFVIAGDGSTTDFWRLASLPLALAEGAWSLHTSEAIATRLAIAWATGSYQFTRYRKAARAPATLVWPKAVDAVTVLRVADAERLARDLINTPAQDLGPTQLAAQAVALAKRLKMGSRVLVGEELLDAGYRLVHAVGRAAADPPRLIDLSWGDSRHPLVALVGKGVCFDSGGLDMKSADNMKLMKKDMGGAAHALALAQMIVQAKLPVRLRVLIPAVENAVAGNALRPLDVIESKKGLTVEIGNTDAEGRLILADALEEASSDKPALLVDLATLTGAARVALGPELPALFSNDDALAAELIAHGEGEADPLWRMPLWKPYRARLASPVADLNNVAEGTMAGAINAAVFLREFVGHGIPWLHVDLFGWNPWAQPGRPVGAQAQTLRALYALIAARFSAAAPRARAARR